MDQLLHGPIGASIAATLFVLGAALLARAGAIWVRSRRNREQRRPMLLPIRAWRYLILAIAVLTGGIGFATGQAWVIVFALVLGFTEGLESSMMVSALADEEWDAPPEIIPARRG
jgi:MFS family permease